MVGKKPTKVKKIKQTPPTQTKPPQTQQTNKQSPLEIALKIHDTLNGAYLEISKAGVIQHGAIMNSKRICVIKEEHS